MAEALSLFKNHQHKSGSIIICGLCNFVVFTNITLCMILYNFFAYWTCILYVLLHVIRINAFLAFRCVFTSI